MRLFQDMKKYKYSAVPVSVFRPGVQSRFVLISTPFLCYVIDKLKKVNLIQLTEGIMKRSFAIVFILSLLVIGVFAGPAAAVDLRHNWTGFYVGLNAGAAFNDSSYKIKPSGDNALVGLPSASGDFDDTTFTGGVEAGYNYQINNFVIGLETDFNYNGIDESEHGSRTISEDSRFTYTVKQDVDYFGTLRARLGYTPTSTLLLYATGGLAYGHVSSSSKVLFTYDGEKYSDSESSVRSGWTIGGGLEYALSCKWSIKAEYLYVDLGSQSLKDGNQFCGESCSYKTDIKTREHVARFGINYKF